MKLKREAAEQPEQAHSGRAAFSQDPHAVREPKENNLEMAIGHEVRAYRKKLGITVTDLAAATGISLGMLSKIENGNISPSLTTLQSLSRALGVPLTAFFAASRNRAMPSSSRQAKASSSNGAARAPAINIICSAISTTIPAASSSSPI